MLPSCFADAIFRSDLFETPRRSIVSHPESDALCMQRRQLPAFSCPRMHTSADKNHNDHRRTGRGVSCPPPQFGQLVDIYSDRVELIREKHNTCLIYTNLGSVTTPPHRIWSAGGCKQFAFAIRAKLGLTPQMDVGPYAYDNDSSLSTSKHVQNTLVSLGRH